MKKMLSKIILLILCCSFCNSCSCQKDDNLVVYRNFYSQDVLTFNYLITNEYNDIMRIANLVDSLVENDKYGNIVPSLATSWKSEMIDNKQVWTFYLRDNVYWSDYNNKIYDKVSAFDFVTSLEYSLNYNTKSNNYNFAASLLENGLNYYNATVIKNYDYNSIINKIRVLEKNDPNREIDFYKNIKNIFEHCSSTGLCIDDFKTVGVKALDDHILQYTLQKPIPYFLSALTYCSFLPVNKKFVEEIGFNNFGTSKKTLLYNGAYILNNYSHSNRIEYKKNANYWDIKNVFIDKLIFTKTMNYQSPGLYRYSYESGAIDEFAVSKKDEKGWETYVGSINLSEHISSPIGDNTYINNEISDFTVYYYIFNQNRTNYKYTSLSENERIITNNALSNINFRKALTHGINRRSYSNTSNNSISSLIPSGFISNDSKDYHTYFVEKYALKNNISYNEALLIFNNDPFYNLEKSAYYLDLAIEELKIKKEDLPIKIEYSYYLNEENALYDKARIEEWNRTLNNCDMDGKCNYEKVKIIFNEEIDSINDYNISFDNREYNMTFLGLYPDHTDPTTYLKAFASNGELSSFINHNDKSQIDYILNSIDEHHSKEEIDTRFDLCSELEYRILFEENLVLPISLKAPRETIIVSNLVPFIKMKASYGLSPFKFKHRKMRTISYSQEDIKVMKKEYEEGRIK